MYYKFAIMILTVVLVLLQSSVSFSWGVKTHESITDYALDSTTLKKCADNADDNCEYLKTYLAFPNELTEPLTYNGLTNGVSDWFKRGSNLEDEAPRWVNHFHNPMWSMGEWDKAGLESPLGRSSPLWAQNSSWQHAWPTVSSPRDWSWPTVREYFYTALTSTDEATRQEYFAMTFRGVGQQMHLLEDMAVPEHVRTGGKS
jgi:hypothetical protein